MSTIEGMEDLSNAFQNLQINIRKNIARGATRSIASAIAKDAKSNVTVDSGNLKRSIGVVARKSDDKTTFKFTVTPRKGKKYNGFYGHMVEFGHAIVKNGQVVGHVPAHPFLRPAYENVGADAVKIFTEYSKKRFDKEVEKAKR